MVLTQLVPLAIGIADDANILSSEIIIIERHRALLVVGDVEEQYFGEIKNEVFLRTRPEILLS